MPFSDLGTPASPPASHYLLTATPGKVGGPPLSYGCSLRSPCGSAGNPYRQHSNHHHSQKEIESQCYFWRSYQCDQIPCITRCHCLTFITFGRKKIQHT